MCQRSISIPGVWPVAFLLLLITASLSAADNDPLFDQFTLHAQVEGEVSNDLLTVELSVQDQDRDSASLANRINANMQWALDLLKRYPTVKSRTRDYRTWPRYERKDNRIIGWHASQTLALESDDFDAAREAIQKLQERLQVSNMQMTPKPATRISVENSLINQALNRFKERADIVQLNMGAADYRIIDVNIATDQHHPTYYERADSRTMLTEAAVAPAIEAGSSKVVVRVDGRIQLQ